MRIDSVIWRTPLIVLGVFIVLQAGALYLLSGASSRAETAQRQLAWVKNQQDVVNWMNARPAAAALNLPLTQVVTEAAKQAGISLPAPNIQGDTLHVPPLQNVDFNQLFAWLQQMQQSAGVIVLTLELTPAADGSVNVSQLVLGRPPRAQ